MHELTGVTPKVLVRCAIELRVGAGRRRSWPESPRIRGVSRQDLAICARKGGRVAPPRSAGHNVHERAAGWTPDATSPRNSPPAARRTLQVPGTRGLGARTREVP